MSSPSSHTEAAPRLPAEGGTGGGAGRLFKTFISLVGAEVVTRGLVLVTGVVLARALSAPAFGDFSYAFGVAVVAGFLVDLGLASLVIRDVSADPARAPGLLAAFLHAQGLLAVGTFALVALLTFGGVVGGPASDEAIMIATAAVCVGAFSRPFEATLTGRGQAHLVTVSRTVRGIVLAVATIAVALTDADVERFLGAWVASEAAGVAAVAFLCVRRSVRPLLTEGRAQVLRLLRLALPFALVTAANVLYMRVDILMLGHLDTAEAVGNYGVATRVMDAAIILPAFFGNAFLATISATGPRTERGRMQTTEAMRWVVLMTAPVAVTLLVAASPIVELIAGDGYDEAGPILARLSPVVMVIAIYGVLASLQVAMNDLRTLMWLFGIGLVVKIAANAYAIPEYGPTGAAVAASIAEIVVAAIQWRWARAWFDVGSAASGVVRVLIAAAISAAVMAVCVDQLPWPVGIAVGLVAYAVAALATGALSRAKVLEAVQAIRA
jgi:O-antigen/teichoic acid export membrane protein